MKNKLWLLQLPFVALFTFAFYVDEMGIQGNIKNTFLREDIFPNLRRVSTLFTDAKFRARGPQPPKNKIVIVEIDSPSIEALGRWPWHRDITALLVAKTFELGAKTIGLDMVFSEPDKRVPDELASALQKNNLADVATEFETDPHLEKVIRIFSDKLVLGWTTEAFCQPGYDGHDKCPVNNPDAIATHPADFAKFACTKMEMPGFDPKKTPVSSFVTLIPNIPMFQTTAKHAGYFNAFQDPDGYIRRSSLLMMGNSKAYPSLPLEMARVGMGEELGVVFNNDQLVESINFEKSGRKLPVTPLGVMEVNFRGPSRTFTYVSAIDVLSEESTIKDELNNKLVGKSKQEVFGDAYVLIGLSALGVFDMRAFPFDSNTPGVEGHATILDNILTGDSIINTTMANGSKWIFCLMIIVAIFFAYLAQRLEAIPALILWLAAFGTFGLFDLKVLFQNNQNWNTSFFYLEMFTICVITLAAKYILEEKNKKFIRGAFTKYVAPAVVDSILKDPSKLSVGGVKKDLTIMFSDIRGFTTFSERLDAKTLAALLNDYLGIMTNIVFANNGTLDKYIGDAIMAFWGAPLDQPKHAADAATTAVNMMKALKENKQRYKEQFGVDINIGVGVNSGIVSVGNMGSQNNFAYTVIGDHVNLASRLEGLTKAYGVNILTTRFTMDHIAESGAALPLHRVLDSVKVKGKKQAVELIELLDRECQEKGLELFQEGRRLYTQQKWDAAIEALTAANVILSPTPEKMDTPCKEFIERCGEFKKNPPAQDWDGSWEMHTK